MGRAGMCGIGDIPHTGIIFGDSILIIADTKLVTTMTRIFITSIIVARGEVGIKDSMAFVPLGPPVLELPVLDSIPLGVLVLAVVALEPPVLDFIPLGPPVLELPVLDSIPLGVLVLAVVALEPPVLDFIPLGPPVLELPVLDITLGLPVLDIIPLGLPVLDTILGLPVLDIILPGVLVLAVVALDPPVLQIVLKPPLPAVLNLGKLLLMRKNIRSSSPTGASSRLLYLGRSGIILKAKSRSPLFDSLNPLH